MMESTSEWKKQRKESVKLKIKQYKIPNLNRKKITMDGIVSTIPQAPIHVEALINVTVFRDRVCRR